MINTNASGIFKKHRLGATEDEEYEDPSQAYEQQQQRAMGEDGVLKALRPINFNDKIMGGQNAASFMDGKLSPLDGSFNYAQRVNMLTGKGVSKMENENNVQNKIDNILGGSSPIDKINMMTGGFNASSKDKLSMLLGNSKSKKDIISSLLGSGGSGTDKISKILGDKHTKKGNALDSFFGSNSSGTDKISKILGDRNRKKKKAKQFNFSFDKKTGFGNRAFAGINMLGSTKQTTNKIKTNLANSRNSALNKIQQSFGILNNKGFNNKINNNMSMSNSFKSMHNLLGNPETIAKRRIKQQNNLPMFGDFDGDKLINALDCDPLDPNKQGGQHKLTKYLPQQNNNKVSFTNESEDIVPEEVDTASADIRMGNTYTGFDNVGNLTDLNNDGVVDNKDETMFNKMSEIEYLKGQIENAKTQKNRQKYILALKDLYKTFNNVEDQKTKRVKIKQDFDKEKWETEREDKNKKELLRNKTILKSKELEKEKLDFDKDLAKQSFNAKREDKKFSDLIGLAQFEYQKQRDSIKDKKQDDKDKRTFNLEKQKLKMESGKNDRMLWESKLKSGQNMLGSLIGGGNKPADLGSKVGSADNTKKLALMSGAMSQGGNPQSMMMMAGAMNQTQPFENKANMIVGRQSSNKGWAQKVNESIGNNTVEQIMKQEQDNNIANYAPQQRENITIPQRPQPMQQPIRQQPQPMQQPMIPDNLDWDSMSPEQIAQYDPEYAKYVAEAEAEGKTGYRRGPYKKH